METSKVVSVRKIGVRRVMDITTEKNHTFITSGGICSGNCDGLTPQAQQSFRPVIEQYAKQTRFIFTCNYINKILPPIQSRCVCYDFNLSKEEKPEVMAKFMKRALFILKEEGIIDINKQALGMLIANLAPDWRRVINTLQTYCTTYEKIDEGIVTFSTGSAIAEELYPLIHGKKFDEARKIVLESSWAPEDIYASLFKYLPEFIEDKGKQAELVLVIAKYQYQSAFSANQDINTIACLVEMMLSA